MRYAKPRQIVLYPTGAGEARVLINDATNYLEVGTWFPDSKRILLLVREPGHEARNVIQNLDGGEPRPILQEGLTGKWISPDGSFLIASSRGQPRAIYPLDGGAPRQLKGLESDDTVWGWSREGKAIYTTRGLGLAIKFYRLSLTTGQKEELGEINAMNAPGLLSIDSLRLAADGKSYAYGYSNFLSHLFLVDELR